MTPQAKKGRKGKNRQQEAPPAAAVPVPVQEEEEEIQEEAVEATALVRMSEVDRAAIDVQVATAKRYPRSIKHSLEEALALATVDKDTAASCFYVLPRGKDNKIEGPSARLAEIMMYSWGNLRVDSEIESEEKTHVVAVGTCFDLEKNVAVRVRVRRRIVDKQNRRFSEDMIGVTSNAAISIALRNSVFKVIPAALTQQVYQAARQASIGDAGALERHRKEALAWFGKAGISTEQILLIVKAKSVADIGTEELVTLRGLATALKEGDTTVAEVIKAIDKPFTEPMPANGEKKEEQGSPEAGADEEAEQRAFEQEQLERETRGES